MPVGVDVLAALEEHVLEEVGEASTSRTLVLRAHVVPEIERYQGQARVVVQDQPQPVVEGVPLQGEIQMQRPGLRGVGPAGFG